MIARIGPHDVYITNRRWKLLEKVALADWSPIDRIGYRIVGLDRKSSKYDEALRRFISHLDGLFAASATAFEEEWVQIDLTGEEARAEVWDLMHDCCLVFGYGRTLDLRSDPLVPALEDMLGLTDPLAHPQGYVFGLEFDVVRQRLTDRLLRKSPPLRVIIDSSRVTKISGRWGDVQVYLGRTLIRFKREGVYLRV